MSSRNRPKAARSLGIRPAKLETEPNNSLDLSICDWHGGPVSDVKLMVDSAPRAQLRYYNLLSEQHQYYNADPGRKARQIKGVARIRPTAGRAPDGPARGTSSWPTTRTRSSRYA